MNKDLAGDDMRITESRLRSVIRSVIKESVESLESESLESESLESESLDSESHDLSLSELESKESNRKRSKLPELNTDEKKSLQFLIYEMIDEFFVLGVLNTSPSIDSNLI